MPPLVMKRAKNYLESLPREVPRRSVRPLFEMLFMFASVGDCVLEMEEDLAASATGEAPAKAAEAAAPRAQADREAAEALMAQFARTPKRPRL